MNEIINKNPRIQIYCGDALKIIKNFPPNSIDCIITDPPYGTNYKKCIGDESTKTFVSILPLLYKVLKINSFFITYVYPKFLYHIITEAMLCNFHYRWVGFNYYPNMFKQKRWPLGYNRYDMFLLLAKGEPKQAGYMKDVVHILMDKNKPIHPHKKPLKAIYKLVKCATKEGTIVLDPFMGSGTTGIACKSLDRQFIGIEIVPNYYDMAKECINNNEVIAESKL